MTKQRLLGECDMNGSVNTYEIKVSELDKLLDMCIKTVEGLSKASNIPKEHRDIVRVAISDTCELIDSILTTVKQRISDIRKVVVNNESYASDMISELGNMSEWEDSYRKFHMCGPLRDAAGELREGILGRFVQYFSFKNTDELKKTIERFLQTEESAGQFVGMMLDDLSKLDSKLGSDREMVIDKLNDARFKIQNYRDKFIELEKKVRNEI